jgi:hypothetical protein
MADQVSIQLNTLVRTQEFVVDAIRSNGKRVLFEKLKIMSK